MIPKSGCRFSEKIMLINIQSRFLFSNRLGAQVAQLVEHCTENAGVGGSIPPLGTIIKIRFLIQLSIFPEGSEAENAGFVRDCPEPDLWIEKHKKAVEA